MNQNATSIEFHTAVTASVTAVTEERFPSTVAVSVLYMFRLIYIPANSYASVIYSIC